MPTAHIGPNCVIGARVQIGPRSVLLGGNHVGRDSRLGEDVCLFPNVVIYPKTVIGHRVVIHAGTVIGSDGYGYVFDEGRHRKVLQVGHVIIHDDVEIGANAAIDRGALGATVIGAGTKIDNLVHVAHNVVMGRHCLVMGQVGFAGSTQLGDYVIIASQSGIAGHLKLGQQAIIGAKSGVMRDIPDGGKVLGIPAMPDKQAKRQMIAVQQLPEMIHRLRELEKQVSELAAKLSPPALNRHERVNPSLREHNGPSAPLDPMPVLPLFPVTIRVNHQQDKNQKAGHHENDDDGLVTPRFAHKIGKIRIHVRSLHRSGRIRN